MSEVSGFSKKNQLCDGGLNNLFQLKCPLVDLAYGYMCQETR